MSFIYKFPDTLPIDITFFNAESLSPIKLNAIFNYIKMAQFSIETFLGNGIDYGAGVNDFDKRRIIGNLSNIIGECAGKIYVPFNYFGSTYTLYKQYGSTHYHKGCTYDDTVEHASFDEETEALIIKQKFNIPIGRKFDSETTIGMHYRIVGGGDYANISVIVYLDSNDDDPCRTSEVSTDECFLFDQVPLLTSLSESLQALVGLNDINILDHISVSIPANKYISHIQFSNTIDSNIALHVHSLYLTYDDSVYRMSSFGSTGIESSKPLNTMYAVEKHSPLKHISRRPCMWSEDGLNEFQEQCPLCTRIGGCIGNTYDIYVGNDIAIENKFGTIVCGGTIKESAGKVHNSLVPYKSGSSGDYYTYSSEYNFANAALSPDYFVVQSSLYSINKDHILRFHAIFISSNDDKIRPGESIIYDIDSTGGNPMLNDATMWPVFDSIGTVQYDAMKAVHKRLLESDSRFMVLSSEVGITNMFDKLIRIKSNINNKTLSVYAD
jgi:hypothetical protein